jgi:glycosyltransferase involved in cell wall biosynthesis
LNVLFIINEFSWGGAEKLVYDLAMNVREYVQNVHIIALYSKGNTTEVNMVRNLISADIKVKIIGKRAGKDRIKSVWEIYKYVEKENISIIHAHCSVPMFFGKIVGFLANVPVICTIHNTRGYNALQEKLTSWMVAQYISIGTAAEEYMVHDLNINPKKIVRIYNAIDVKKIISGKATPTFWKQFGGSKQNINLLNVARVSKQKNQLCILRAVLKCKQNRVPAHLFILGDYETDKQTYNELYKYIQSNNLSEYVTFLGMHDNVSDFLHNADCFIMTSWYEGLSVAFLEAVVSGLPIITTEMPFVKNLMKLGKCASVIAQDDDVELYKLISTKNWAAPSPQVIHIFQKLFSMDTFVSQHLKVYEHIVDKK